MTQAFGGTQAWKWPGDQTVEDVTKVADLRQRLALGERPPTPSPLCRLLLPSFVELTAFANLTFKSLFQ